jgi:hypothetical protein
MVLRALTQSIPGHRLIPANVSILDSVSFPELTKASPKTLTDLYLLALAVHQGAFFVTFDLKIDATQIPGGPGAYHTLTP